MKHPVLSLIVAGTIGGLITLGGSKLLDSRMGERIHIRTEQTKQVSDESKVHHRLTSSFPNNDYANGFTVAAKKTMPAVVNVTSVREVQAQNAREQRYYQFFGIPKPSVATGSGVIITHDGYIVTNNHVINGASTVEVMLQDNRKYQAKVVGTDPSTDLAVLKVDDKNLPILEMANSDKAQVGEWVLAVGNPFELNSTVTAGIISAKGRDISILNGQSTIESFIQTDAAVNPGNSGGALVNTKGELLGINTAIATPTGTYAGYSFAVPINLVKKVVQDLIDFGEVKRAFLGITIFEMNDAVAKQMNISIREGVYVSEVMKDSGAKSAGMQEGDVIVKVNGHSTKSVPELQEQIGSRNPGDDVVVTAIRNGQEKIFKVELKD